MGLFAALRPLYFANSAARILMPGRAIAPLTRTQIAELTPGDTRVINGRNLMVTARLDGEIPKGVWIAWREAGGRWQKALDEKPDYVLIQFGHNDSHASEKPESTDASTTYKANLRRYIDEARAIGAIPILVTPMVRRTFDAAGKITDAKPPSKPLESYAIAMKQVAVEKKVALINLFTSSKQLADKLGPSGSAEMEPKKGDNTHFNEKGARAMADLVVKELPDAVPKLAASLKTP